MLAIIVKATFTLPERSRTRVEAAEVQLPLTTTDEYYDGDVTGSVRIESDLVPFKPRADVVLVGHAYAPGGRPVEELDVSLWVGRTGKEIRVFGDRVWFFPTRMMMVPLASDPIPFFKMPLVYERAFGGIDHNGGAWCRET